MADEPRSCKFCDGPVSPGDLAEGRAALLFGRLYCPRCLVSALEREMTKIGPAQPPGVAASPPVPDGDREPSERTKDGGADRDTPRGGLPSGGEDRRAVSRYVPPYQAGLVLRLPGLFGLCRGNLVQFWVEVSEGGLRAIVTRKLSRGDVLRARLSLPARSFGVDVEVRHVSESRRSPGAFLAGFRFVDPAPEFLTWVREHLCRFPAVAGPRPRGRPAPPPEGRSG